MKKNLSGITTQRNGTRSDTYQHKICEISVVDYQMEEYSNSDSILSILNPNQYNERLFELKEKLLERFWFIVDKNLTEKQKKVLHMTSEGFTQKEIAKVIGVQQSSITKSIYGSMNYGKRKMEGGSKKRLLKLAENDEIFKSILEEIEEIKCDN